MLNPNTPIFFADGSKIYEQLAKKYKTHKHGFFILAPSGSGKTHFIKSQSESDWIDGDELWVAANAHPDNAWWEAGDAAESLREVDARSDIITMQAVKLGFWVMGASNLWLRPDAIVMPDWETHKGYISHRETNNYDGGANTERLQQVLDHRARIMKHAQTPMPDFRSLTPVSEPVPVFSSVAEAVDQLISSL
jgi:hypothetical protein